MLALLFIGSGASLAGAGFPKPCGPYWIDCFYFSRATLCPCLWVKFLMTGVSLLYLVEEEAKVVTSKVGLSGIPHLHPVSGPRTHQVTPRSRTTASENLTVSSHSGDSFASLQSQCWGLCFSRWTEVFLQRVLGVVELCVGDTAATCHSGQGMGRVRLGSFSKHSSRRGFLPLSQDPPWCLWWLTWAEMKLLWSWACWEVFSCVSWDCGVFYVFTSQLSSAFCIIGTAPNYFSLTSRFVVS